ncbi:hypothetical protein BDQ12DRAFT_699551 [Crucibulum laeve]|uniref:Uncharacterized protein n=1 Tax=Crucibulum laeve TaxID=68775 RepID=A0A5C3LUW4_9AGAR|nr:hypothetical protein BDQ12DRAFT_699551 [Crucibulum laeve]
MMGMCKCRCQIWWSTDFGEKEEIILDPGDDADILGYEDGEDDTAIQEEVDASLEEDEGDEGQAIHNDKVAKTICEKAIQYMADKGVLMDSDEAKIALQIFPQASGLACHVHDSPTLKEQFDKLVSEDTELKNSQQTLSHQVTTRWNSDLDCLKSHLYFWDILEQLTAIPSLNLKAYSLSLDQWKMAEDVYEILLLFDELTHIFSAAKTPLIVNAIPVLEELHEGLISACDDNENNISTVVQIACQAGLLLIDKYSAFAHDCDIYIIAIVMCPDHKLKWFKDHGRTSRQIKDIEKMVVSKWKNNYQPLHHEYLWICSYQQT